MKVLSPAVAYLHWAVKISKSASYILCRQNIAFKTPNVFKKYGNVTRKGKTWPYSNIKINDSRFLWPQGDRDHVIKAKSVVRVHTINIGSWLGDTRWMTGFHNDNGWDSPVDIGVRIVTAVFTADIITLLFIIHAMPSERTRLSFAMIKKHRIPSWLGCDLKCLSLKFAKYDKFLDHS